MKTEIQIFKNEVFGEIRTMANARGEVFFVGKDVATALGYSNPRDALKKHVDAEDKGVAKRDTLGGVQEQTIVNESGLYSLILSSKLPQARAFKHWVTSEVLPAIRVTGGYIPIRNARTGEALTEGEVVEAANRIMARTIERRNLPADSCLTASDIAKVIGIAAKDLNSLLVDKGIIRWTGGRYHMTPAYSDQGYDASRLFCYHSKKGEPKQRTYLVWTPAGVEFIKKNVK